MKFIISFFIGLFLTNVAFSATVSTKVLIPKDVSGCELNADSSTKHFKNKPITALGEFTGGDDCFDGWTSAVDFAHAWEMIRFEKGSRGQCDKKSVIHAEVALVNGRNGQLENYSAIGDCTVDNVVYTKYTADREN